MATKTVWKFTLPGYGELDGDEFDVSLPAGARVLTVQWQKALEHPQLWALVDPQAPPEPRRFRIAGTGHPIEHTERLRYVGSVQLADGHLVFHYFELTGGRG